MFSKTKSIFLLAILFLAAASLPTKIGMTFVLVLVGYAVVWGGFKALVRHRLILVGFRKRERHKRIKQLEEENKWWQDFLERLNRSQ